MRARCSDIFVPGHSISSGRPRRAHCGNICSLGGQSESAIQSLLSLQRLTDDVLVLNSVHATCRVDDSLDGRNCGGLWIRLICPGGEETERTLHCMPDHQQLKGRQFIEPLSVLLGINLCL